MSKASWSQAKHVLTIFDQQELTLEQVEVLNGGYLAALTQGAKSNSLPPLPNFREFCGIAIPSEPPPPLLVFDDAHVAVVNLSGPHDPAAFWRDTDEAPARRIWGRFSKIVARARPVGPMGTFKMPYADTSRNTTAREILAAPGVGDHGTSKGCAVIAAMISAQPKGEFLEHGLLNDGRGNLFKCGSALVYVYWDGVFWYWYVIVWYPDLEVDAGRRVFSGN